MAAPGVRRADVLAFRVRQHQLDHEAGAPGRPSDVALLDYGVQDTGPDGAAWALAIRGFQPGGEGDLAYAWTLRGAPHAYRRRDIASVAVATAPLSEADAAKRMFDASKPLKDAGIPTLDALKVVAGHMRAIAAEPIVKGDVSGRLTEVVDEPYKRACRPCATVHVYEMPFRLAALQAGLELEPGTSPPVLRPIPGMDPPLFERLAGEADARFDVIRNYLRFYGPARAGDAAAFFDGTLKDVRAAWPSDAVEVTVADAPAGGRAQARYVLAEHLDDLRASAGSSRTVRLVGPYDPYLQLRDRELLVADEARRKDLWRVLGRPGAIVIAGEVAGTWRPRTSGRRLTVNIDPWGRLPAHDRKLVEEQAERLATSRGVALAGVAAA